MHNSQISSIKSALDGALWLTSSLPIRLFGDPILHKPCDKISDQEIADGLAEEWASELINFMRVYRDKFGFGRGLAANQIGISKRIILVWLDSGPEIYINPEVVTTEGRGVYPESCISSAMLIIGEVTRPWAAKVRYTTLDGQQKVIEPDGAHCRLLLHEIDHLEGAVCSEKYNHGTIKIASGKPEEILSPKLRRLE